jgi:hypothetical protein
MVVQFQNQTLSLIDDARKIINDLADYWPLTLRQIYYQLVAAMLLANCIPQYKRLSRVLSDARLADMIPWECMEDRSRSFLASGGWWNADQFIHTELENFLAGYRRDLLQTQEHRLEIWVEKDALSGIVHQAAFPYCIDVVVAKGFSSTTYVNSCRQRILADIRPTIVLYFGDFDPSGWEMPDAMRRKLLGKMQVGEDRLQIKRCGLLPEQIAEHQLPEDPEAMKAGDTRTKKFKELFGVDVAPVELDALRPDALQDLARQCIEAELDLAAFHQEQLEEAEERHRINSVSEQVQQFVQGLTDE